jgi:hypothetical protein
MENVENGKWKTGHSKSSRPLCDFNLLSRPDFLMAEGIRQQRSPYGPEIREVVVHMYHELNMSMEDISYHLGGHPNRDTVGKILADYTRQGYSVSVPSGKRGMQYAGRKFGASEWTTLMELIVIDCQQTLHGALRVKWSSQWLIMNDVSPRQNACSQIWQLV